jgi:dephospho-CoA kinase
MSHFVVGVTGGIGSGKTTVTDLFAERGICVVDADVIAREVVAKGSDGLAKIQAYFSNIDGAENVILDNGELNRPWLRQRVFSHPNEKKWLDNLLHPLIRNHMIEQTKSATSAYCLLSVPLLIENKLNTLVDRVLVVDLDEATQLARAVGRDAKSVAQKQQTEATIRAIMQNQCSRQQRLAVADDVVNNSGHIASLREQVDSLHQQYLTLANKK